MSDPVAVRVASYTKDQRRRGLVRVAVWVPKQQVEELKQVAARMRKSAGLRLPTE